MGIPTVNANSTGWNGERKRRRRKKKKTLEGADLKQTPR
jgi:hypothetical protein